MEPNFGRINTLLVEAFNDILVIEESELKKSQFKDLSITEMHTIEAIGMYKKKTTSEVAKELSITVGTLTIAINRLVKKDYVERLRSEDDRRVVKLGLTKKGRLIFRVHQRFHMEMVKSILQGMDNEESVALQKALENLHSFLQDYKLVCNGMNNFGQITQTASFVPDKAVTNDQLAQIMDTSDEWIQSRTGIKERRITTTENTSDLCIKVAEKLLEKSQYSAKELDFIIVATMSPDYYSPSVACLVQGAIGANHAMCFDLSAACSGFVYALSVADKLVRTGAKKGLVIGGEVISKTLDWTDRSTAVLFGDGAGGVLLEASETEHITAENLQADGKRAMSLTSGFTAVNSPYSESETSQSSYLSMEGREIFDFAVRDVVEQIKKVMNQQNREIDYFLLHQANARILDKIAKKVNVSRDKFLQNMDRYGNTSAASIPILLDEAVASKKIVLGNQQNVILSGFGGGLTWATVSVIL